MADADRCVMCGEILPEGALVCMKCTDNAPKGLSLYAIKHKGTGRLVTDTDFRYHPPRQILSNYDSPILLTAYNLTSELQRRKVSTKYYTVVKVTVEEEKPKYNQE